MQSRQDSDSAQGTSEETSERARRATRTRDQILDAAIDVFAEHGFEGSTLSNVAQRSGHKIPLIVYHFDNKETLWRAAVTAVWERTQTRIREIALDGNAELDGTAQTAGMTRDRFRSSIAALADAVAEHPEYLRILLREASHRGPRFDWLVKNHLARDYREARAFVCAAQEHCLLPDVPPEHMVYMLTGMLYFPMLIEADVQEQTGNNPRSRDYRNSYTEAIMTLLGSSAKREGNGTAQRH